MSNVQEALKAAIEAFELHAKQYPHMVKGYCFDALEDCKAALAEIEKCEPVAEAIRERDRLGFAVVNVIGKLDEIIENTQEVEVDDFLHIAVPVDMWNELQAALEDMPKRADLYTSPQPIEKCEPVYLISSGVHEIAVSKAKYDEWTSEKHISYTSPQPRDWVELSDNFIAETIWENTKLNPNIKDDAETLLYVTNAVKAILAESKQLNTKG